MRCLGHFLTDSGSIAIDFHNAVGKMWGSFYANQHPALKKASLKGKQKFLTGCIRPVAAFRWTRWPFQSTYASRLDSVQTNMVGRLIDVTPNAQEDAQCYFRRRRHICRQIATSWGPWSSQWKRHVVTWGQHIERAHDSCLWSHKLIGWRGEGWLHERCVENSQDGALNRTATRLVAGRPATRWHEGFAAAKE